MRWTPEPRKSAASRSLPPREVFVAPRVPPQAMRAHLAETAPPERAADRRAEKRPGWVPRRADDSSTPTTRRLAEKLRSAEELRRTAELRHAEELQRVEGIRHAEERRHADQDGRRSPRCYLHRRHRLTSLWSSSLLLIASSTTVT